MAYGMYRHPRYDRLFSEEEYKFYEGPWFDDDIRDWFDLSQDGATTFLRGSENPILVFIDGACAGNGTPLATGGYGVYWGPNSDYNVCKPLKASQPQTSQRAELTAAIVALNQIERQSREWDNPSNVYILVTDSAYLVNSMTNYVYKWRVNDYTAATGREVVNRDLFERLDYKLDVMSEGRQNIDVLFWKVDRFYNQDADRLAKTATSY
jgi:ribonuclease HI